MKELYWSADQQLKTADLTNRTEQNDKIHNVPPDSTSVKGLVCAWYLITLKQKRKKDLHKPTRSYKCREISVNIQPILPRLSCSKRNGEQNGVNKKDSVNTKRLSFSSKA